MKLTLEVHMVLSEQHLALMMCIQSAAKFWGRIQRNVPKPRPVARRRKSAEHIS